MRVRTATRFIATKAAPKEVELRDASLRRRRNKMRLTPLVSAVLALAVSGPVFAQEWIEFASREDRFTCNFPTQPKITQTTYRSQMGADLPARVYSAEQGRSRYSLTVVDYNQAQPILKEKTKSCPAGTEPGIGSPVIEGTWKADLRGTLVI